MINLQVFSPSQRVIALLLKCLSDSTTRVTVDFPYDVDGSTILKREVTLGASEGKFDYDSVVPHDDTITVRDRLLRVESYELFFRIFRSDGSSQRGVLRVRNDLLTDEPLPRVSNYLGKDVVNGFTADNDRCAYEEAIHTTYPTYRIGHLATRETPACLRPLYQYALESIDTVSYDGQETAVIEVRGPSNILYGYAGVSLLTSEEKKDSFVLLTKGSADLVPSSSVEAVIAGAEDLTRFETKIFVEDTEGRRNPFVFGQRSYGPNRARIDSESAVYISKIATIFEIFRLARDNRIAASDLLHQVDVNEDYTRSVKELLDAGVSTSGGVVVPTAPDSRGNLTVSWKLKEIVNNITSLRKYFNDLYRPFSYDRDRIIVTNDEGKTAVLTSTLDADDKLQGCFVLAMAYGIASKVQSACPHLTFIGVLTNLINTNAVNFKDMTFFGNTSSMTGKEGGVIFVPSPRSVFGSTGEGRLVNLLRDTISMDEVRDDEYVILGLDFDGDKVTAEHYVVAKKKPEGFVVVYDPADKFYGVLASERVVDWGFIRIVPTFERKGLRMDTLFSTSFRGNDERLS